MTIHQNLLNSFLGNRAARVYHNNYWMKVASLLEGHTHTAHTHLLAIFESPFHLRSIFLDCWRKLEFLEKTKTCTRRTCKLHTAMSQPGFEPGPHDHHAAPSNFWKICLDMKSLSITELLKSWFDFCCNVSSENERYNNNFQYIRWKMLISSTS